MYKFALDKAYVVGKDIASASATPSTTSTSWDVNLNFKGTGTKQFGDLTTRMYDKYTGSQAPPNWLGVVLDGVVVSAPYVQTPTTNGQTLISGSFSQTDATTLANQLSYGALPLTFAQESVQSVSPQLGRDQLDAGLIAAALGLLLVVIYLLLYYRGRVVAVEQQVAGVEDAILDEEDDHVAVGVAASEVIGPHGLAADLDLLRRPVERVVRQQVLRRAILPVVGVERLQVAERPGRRHDLRADRKRRIPVRVIEVVVRVQHGDDRLRGQLGHLGADRVALADEGHRVDDDCAVARHEDRRFRRSPRTCGRRR